MSKRSDVGVLVTYRCSSILLSTQNVSINSANFIDEIPWWYINNKKEAQTVRQNIPFYHFLLLAIYFGFDTSTFRQLKIERWSKRRCLYDDLIDLFTFLTKIHSHVTLWNVTNCL